MSGEPEVRPVLGLERWLDTTGKSLGLVLAPLLLVVILLVPIPGLTPAAHKLLAVVAFTTVLWVSEAVPLAATALLAPALCVVLGVGKAGAIFAPFGSPTTFLFIGMFTLGIAMQKHGLDRRIALTVLSWPGVSRSPVITFGALATLTALLSMWMSNIAAAAVMIPIGLGAMRANPGWGEEPRHRGSLVLLIAFSASMGGLATPVGTPPNLIGIGLLEQMTGDKVNFFEWMRYTLPLTVALVAFLVWRLRPVGAQAGARDLRTEFLRQKAALGERSLGELSTQWSFLGAILLWMYPGLVEFVFEDKRWGAAWLETHFPEEMVGLLAGVALFFLPGGKGRREFAVAWSDAVKLDWSTIVLFGGGMSLGRQIFDTGLADAGGRVVIATLGQPGLFAVVLASVGLSVLLSTLTSNTASANVMVPMMLAVAQAAGVNPVPVGIATCLACSFGNMLPVSTGTNAVAYGTGHVRLIEMVRHGFWLDIVGVTLLVATIMLLVA